MSSDLCQPFFFFLLWSIESWLQAMQMKVSIPTTPASAEQHTGEEWRAMGILSIILLWRQWKDGEGTQGKHYGKTTQTVLTLGRTNPKRLQETNGQEKRKKDENRRLSKTSKEWQSHLLPVCPGRGRSRPGALHLWKKQSSAHHSPIFLKSLLLLLQATINLILSPLTSLIVPFQCQLVSY